MAWLIGAATLEDLHHRTNGQARPPTSGIDRNGALLEPPEYARQWPLPKRHLVCISNTLVTTLEADLYADASGVGAGVILIQIGNVVALASRKP